MSEIYDALLKAQREVKRDPSAPDSPKNGNGAGPEPPRRSRSPERKAFRWPWSSQNGHARATDFTSTLIAPDGHGEMAEPFRVLRSTIMGLASGMLMITSPLDEEGKTLCAANLAISLALPSTRDVLLVDLDLRRPAVAPRFGIRSELGMTDCLQGKAKWQDCLRATNYPRLKLLLAGTYAHHAPELLATDALQSILSEMRTMARDHFIVFDTPPILLASDPLLLAAQMDHIVLMVRAGSTPRKALVKAVDAIGTEKLLGVVFNEATVQPSDYYRYGKHHLYYGPNGQEST